ncbi:hypothetical protein K3495_g8451 [Podosphaera aphanis]|nr:hypothetical protein K3495_g8451 [Podosphaera aphanis]
MGDFTGYSSGTDTNSWIAPDTLSMSEPSQEAPPYWVTNSQESSLTSSYSPFNSCLEAPSLPSWPAGHIDSGFREDLTWPPQAMPSYNSLQDINSPHQYAQYSAAASNSMNYHVAKRPASQSSGLYPAPILSSVNQIAATEQGDDRPRHLNMTNIPLHLPISPWEHPFSYQKHLSPSSEQCTSWEEGHGDAIPLHVEAVHESLSSFTDDTSGREIYFPLNQER